MYIFLVNFAASASVKIAFNKLLGRDCAYFSEPQLGKFLAVNLSFGRSFSMKLERDCHEVEVTANLEL
jgi:hypothetical protein